MRILGIVASSLSKVASLIDTFTRTTSGSLGGTWSNIIGTWYANGSQAQNDGVSSNISLTAATAGGENPLLTADVSADNVGVSFWVSDSNNYWAATTNQAIITTYTYSSTCATYAAQGYNYSFSCTGYAICVNPVVRYGACSYYSSSYTVCSQYGRYGLCIAYSTVSGSVVCVSGTSTPQGYNQVCSTYQSTLTNTTYSGGERTFNLIKKVGGTLSTVYTKVITAGISSYKIVATASGWLWVRAFPSTGQSGIETISYLSQPTSPVKGTKQGLYIDLSGYQQVRTADNVSISGANESDITQGTASVSGGTLTSDDAYYYRTFTGNGTLSVTGTLKCDILIGGGGADGGSGGGSYNPGYIATGNLPFVIGASNNDSTGLGFTAYKGGANGGGYGVSGGTYAGANGGSGGGGVANVGWSPRCADPSGWCNQPPGGSATQASGGTVKYGTGGAGYFLGTYCGGGGGGGGWGSGGGSASENGCPGTNCYCIGAGRGGEGTTEFTNWCKATGIGQLEGGVYYLGGGKAGVGYNGDRNGYGSGANTAGYNSSGFVMVRYLKSAVA